MILRLLCWVDLILIKGRNGGALWGALFRATARLASRMTCIGREAKMPR